MPDAKVAFQPQTRRSPDADLVFQCQTRRSPDANLASSVRRGGRIPTSDVEVARRGPASFLSQTQKSSDADLASFVRRGGRQTQRSRFNSNASLSSFVFQHRREPVSFASQHQSEVRVQREARISAITDSHELDQLHPIFSPHNSCLLYTSPSPRDRQKSRMPSSA